VITQQCRPPPPVARRPPPPLPFIKMTKEGGKGIARIHIRADLCGSLQLNSLVLQTYARGGGRKKKKILCNPVWRARAQACVRAHAPVLSRYRATTSSKWVSHRRALVTPACVQLCTAQGRDQVGESVWGRGGGNRERERETGKHCRAFPQKMLCPR